MEKGVNCLPCLMLKAFAPGVAVPLATNRIARVATIGAVFGALWAALVGCGDAPLGAAEEGASSTHNCDALSGGGMDGVGCAGITPVWPDGPEDDIQGLPAADAKYKNCSALWTCGVTACQSNPSQDCLRPCLEAASSELVAAFSDVTKCAIHVCAKSQCAGSSAQGCVSECMWSRCLGFGVACSAPARATGSTSCGEALDCVKLCEGQMACLSGCYAAMAAPGQSAFLALWSCIATSDAADPFVDCYDMALACGGSGSETGAKSCYDLLQCSGGCGDNLTSEEFNCNATCYSQGSESARAQFRKVVNCYTGFASGHGPGDCAAVLATCVEAGGALTCPEIDPCAAQCKKTGKSQGVCTFKYLKQASPKEGQRFLEFMLCGSVTCGQQCKDGLDEDCVSKCRQATCEAQSDACLGGI